MGGPKTPFDNKFGPSRVESKQKADEQKRSLFAKLTSKLRRTQAEHVPAQERSAIAESVGALPAQPASLPEYVKAQYGKADVPVFDRGAPDITLYPEPWLARAVQGALLAAANQEIRLQLVWPGTIASVPLVHALATLERWPIGDKRGLRALVFPTKRTSFAGLSKFLLGREKLLEWSHTYFTLVQLPGVTAPLPGRDNPNKDMLLQAVKSAWNQDHELPSPCIGEVLPHFDWDIDLSSWGTYASKYLSRTRRSLQRAYKIALWKEGDRIDKLGDPAVSPDALFGVSHLATAKQRRAAISSAAVTGEYQPELVLFDLTKSIRWTTERNLIRLVPEVIEAINTSWKKRVGFLLITDDPKTYFVLRSQLADKKQGVASRNVISDPIVATGSDYGLSNTRRPLDWSPATVSNKHFVADVLDQEMAEAATRLWTIGQALVLESNPQRLLRSASTFLLRLANLPGGYRDYVAWMEASAFADSIRAELTWNGHVARLASALDRGEFGDKAEGVRKATQRATKLVESYNDQTPLARRIAKLIAACLTKPKFRLAIFFRSNTDVAVAKAFLNRNPDFPVGADFSAVEGRVDFLIHKELGQVLEASVVPTRFVFVGLPDETLKELLTSEKVPADSIVFVDWRRANSVLIGLRALKSVDVFKAYRGRISEFGDELERRLKEVPQAIDIEKIDAIRVPRLSLSAAAADASRRDEGPGGAYKLELEDRSRIIAGQRMYVYDPDELKPFQFKDIEEIKQGDSVFVMSDELKDMFEVALIGAGHGIPRGSNFGQMLRNYHRDVLANSKRIFAGESGATLARSIQRRMKEISPELPQCSASRIRYWIDVEGSADTQAEDLKPHSTWSKEDFETFARALEVPENLIAIYWLMVAKQRTALQQAGRELADRYARVLFREDEAAIHFRLNRETMLRLQDEAVRNTYRVLRVIPPQLNALGPHVN